MKNVEQQRERANAPDRERVLHRDLDRFAGSWTEDEAKELDEAVRPLRRIDPDLWK